MNRRYVSCELVFGQVGLLGTAEKSEPAGVIMVQAGSFDPGGINPGDVTLVPARGSVTPELLGRLLDEQGGALALYRGPVDRRRRTTACRRR